MYLQLHHTTIGYDRPLISDITTSLDLGEVALLIGNNGVGKTTLFKSILNQIPILSGTITINDKKTSTLSVKEIAQQIAMVFSKAPIPAHYTVTDLIAFGKYIHYPYYFELSSKDKEEVQNIIQQLHLEEYQHHLLKNLSDGNLQKAFIGRAIAQNSPIVILDEPTAHLDEENKIMILKLLRNLAIQQNKLIIFSSHDWRLAKEFSDTIWLVKNQSIYAGITEDILSQFDELAKPQLFQFSEKFVAPTIKAPQFEAEILYSFLQKKYQKDLSSLNFGFKDNIWVITDGKNQHFAQNFEEIHQIIVKNG